MPSDSTPFMPLELRNSPRNAVDRPCRGAVVCPLLGGLFGSAFLPHKVDNVGMRWGLGSICIE